MRRRRRKNRIVPVLIVLLVLALAGAVLLKFVFVVRNVNVAGSSGMVSHEGVIRAARVNFGASIFTVSEEDIMQHINSTGTLRAVDVQVHYPDSLTISVQPRSRVAMALGLGQLRVLDETGCVITSVNTVPNEDLVYVSGLQVQGCTTGEPLRADEHQMQAYCAVMQAILEHSASMYVSELNLENTNDIRIITRTGITVELGTGENARNKIAWMKSAVADLENRGQVGGTLDVRSGNKADYRSAY